MRIASIVATAGLICAASAARAGEPQPMTEEEKAIYSLGAKMGQGIAFFEFTPREMEILKRALVEAARGQKPAIDLNEYPQTKIDALAKERSAAVMAREEARGKAYAAKAAKEEGALVLDNGLVLKTLRLGTGSAPGTSSRVTVHMRGTLVDGTEIDNTYARNKPLEFPLGPNVIPCWTEGIRRMKPGGKARVVCPATLAWGSRGRIPSVPPGATVVYELELLSAETR